MREGIHTNRNNDEGQGPFCQNIGVRSADKIRVRITDLSAWRGGHGNNLASGQLTEKVLARGGAWRDFDVENLGWGWD